MEEIKNYLDISTGHIKPENVDKILNKQGELPTETFLYGYPYDYGTFITIGSIENVDTLINDYNNGFDDIINIVRFCNRHNISLIRFDADAEKLEDFQTYDW